MTVDADRISIACKKCGETHRYPLAIERSVVMGYTGAFGPPEQPKTVHFTRLFICPKTDEQFQARLGLTEFPSAPIKAVSVGAADED